MILSIFRPGISNKVIWGPNGYFEIQGGPHVILSNKNYILLKIKAQGKVHPRRGDEGPDGE
jgi:hypothetical protein